MKRILLITASALVFGLLLLYIGDYLLLRHKINTGNAPYGTVTIQTYYVIPHKDGKAEYDFTDPETETCTHSIFPQDGKRSCWWAARHATKEIAP